MQKYVHMMQLDLRMMVVSMSEYAESVFKVDLTTGKFEKETLEPALCRKFLGGSGVGWKLIADLIEPGIDPLSPKNVIVINPGILVGTLTFGSPKTTVITKFPVIATEDNRHFIEEATAGGRYFGLGLKMAGCDHLVITGKADGHVYIRVTDENVEIVDAENLWGRGIQEVTNELVRKEGERTGVVAIGKAGENLVRLALAIVDKTNSLGRSGLGAVMGSKNFKAIVARGTGDIKVAKPDEFMTISRELRNRIRNWPRREHWIIMGLAAGWSDFKHTQYPGKWPKQKWDELYGEKTRLETLEKVIPCISCMLSCRLMWKIKGGEFDGEIGFGSPFSKSATSGMLLDVEDHRKIIHLVKLGNDEAGIDFYTTTRLIDFVTTLYEQGVITKKHTGGFELKRCWETYLKLLIMTVEREGFGDILADGWIRLKKEFGLDPQDYWYGGICKGVDFIYDARPSRFHPLMMTFFTRPRPHHGGSHTRTNSPNRPLNEIRNQVEGWGIPLDAIERIFEQTPYSGKFNVGRYTKYMEDIMRVNNALGICSIFTYQALISGEDMARLYSAKTGNSLTAGELMKAGERISNIAKLINVREGFTRNEDKVPETWLRPMESPEGKIELMDYYGTQSLTKSDIEKMLDEYYDERGWNLKKGIPAKQKLQELGLEEYITF